MIALAAAVAATEAPAQDTAKCRLVKVGGAGFVQQCGDRLHAFGLSMVDIRRSAPQGNDPQGWFSFTCPFEPLCVDEPDVRGAFFDAEGWKKGSKDAQAVWDVVERRSSLRIRGEPNNSPCEVFDVEIAGLSGRAVCYQSAERSAIITVVNDEDVGFILIFLNPHQDWSALRDKVLQLLPRFSVGRASGDAALLGWLR